MNRELLYRTVLRNQEGYIGYHDMSGPLDFATMSPVSSLIHGLHGTTLTPVKRLSLSSTSTGTPQSLAGMLNLSSDTSQSDSASLCSPFVSPTTKRSPMNKENRTPGDCCESPASHNYPDSTSFTAFSRHGSKSSPLKELSANRSLSFSPLKKGFTPLKDLLSPVSIPSPLLECDSGSRDSGYSESVQKKDDFSIPRSCLPTRKLNLDQSPPKVFVPKCNSFEKKRLRSFASLTKTTDNLDANLMELLVYSAEDECDEPSASASFSSLLSAPITHQKTISSKSDLSPPVTPVGSKLPIRRCLSMCDTSTPLSSRVETSITKTESIPALRTDEASSLSCKTFKRPQPPSDSPSIADTKRRRLESNFNQSEDNTYPKTIKSRDDLPRCVTKRHYSSPENVFIPDVRPKLHRHHSESHVSIMKALNNSADHNGDLTGDFSCTHILPLIEGGKHPDLRSISVHTMASLVKGEFKDEVNYTILDCRYPYEYEGGRIEEAINWHHPQMVVDHLNAVTGPPKIAEKDTPRNILIFHCEFSAERGPKAQRMLRENDRWTNKEYYPGLHFPETYLLEGGYKAFFDAYPELCTPQRYVKMLDDNHTQDLKHFRAKSKSWASETKQFHKGRLTIARTGPKRLGL